VLVPDLRPLSVGEIIDAAIKIWRRHFPTLARLVFVVVAPVQVLSALVRASVGAGDTVFNGVDAAGNPSVDTHALPGWLAGMFTAQALSALAFLIASAAVLRAVSVAYLGGTPEWRDSLKAATSRLRSLIWLGLLMGGALFLAALALFVPFIWLGVSWSVAFPVLIAEGERGTGALRRAYRLVRGRWWPTFGALLVAFMFQFFLGLVLGIPLALLTASWDSGSTAAIALTSVVSVASSVVTTPFMAAVLVLVYFDLRVRKEGFDLELLSQGVGIPGAVLPSRGSWLPPGAWGDQGAWGTPQAWGSPGAWGTPSGWGGSGGWPAPSGGWPAPAGGWPHDATGTAPTTEGWSSPGEAGAPGPAGAWGPPGTPEPTSRATTAPPAPPEPWEEPSDPTGGWGPPPPPDASPPEPPSEPPADIPAAGESPERS